MSLRLRYKVSALLQFHYNADDEHKSIASNEIPMMSTRVELRIHSTSDRLQLSNILFRLGSRLPVSFLYSFAPAAQFAYPPFRTSAFLKSLLSKSHS